MIPQWQGFLSFLVCPPHSPLSRLGLNKRLIGTHSSDSWPEMARWNEMKAQVKEEEGKTFMVMAIFFPNKYYVCWHPALQEVAKYLPAIGSSDWVPLSASLACAAFALAIKLSLFQSLSLLPFHFLRVPQETGESKQICVGLAVGQVNPPQRLSCSCCLSTCQPMVFLSPSAFTNPCSLMLRQVI